MFKITNQPKQIANAITCMLVGYTYNRDKEFSKWALLSVLNAEDIPGNVENIYFKLGY